MNEIGLRRPAEVTGTALVPREIFRIVAEHLPRIEPLLAQYIADVLGDAAQGEFASAMEIFTYFEPLVLRQERTAPSDLLAFANAVLPHVGIVRRAILIGRMRHSDRFAGATRLPGGAITVLDFAANVMLITGAGGVDVTHAGTRAVVSRVDTKKLEKAELKLKSKLEKRNAAFEVSFKTIGKNAEGRGQGGSQQHGALTDAQIKDILAARGTKATGIHLENFDISVMGQLILTKASLSLVHGRRYGLVGRNGIGKSTLLRALVAREIHGMSAYNHVSIGHLEQEISGDSCATCVESVVQADVYRSYLMRQESEIMERLARVESSGSEGDELIDDLQAELRAVHDKMEQIGASTAEARACAILSGLSFSAEMLKMPSSKFSGGWRMRIALAQALFVRPDLLLLDEPTNHLDIPAVVWLSTYLAKWPATLLVVSHDKAFLDAIATDILYMHDARLDVYHGDFTSFERTRDERKRQAMREYESQMKHRKHLQEFVDKWRYNAKRAAQAQSRIKILENMEDIEVLTEELQVTFTFPEPEKLSGAVLQLQCVSFWYGDEEAAGGPGSSGSQGMETPGRMIVKDVDLDVRMDSRIAIVGPNGAGKSTVLKLLTGALEARRGVSYRNARARVAVFGQHHVESLEDLQLTPVQYMGRQQQHQQQAGQTDEEYRRQLGGFGISGRVGLRAMSALSGGQKSRVVFAGLAAQRPSILVLDEPTNHLDYMSVESLAAGLRAFGGGVIVVSHDQAFIEQVCNEIWVCDGASVRKFEGAGISEYRRSLQLGE